MAWPLWTYSLTREVDRLRDVVEMLLAPCLAHDQHSCAAHMTCSSSSHDGKEPLRCGQEAGCVFGRTCEGSGLCCQVEIFFSSAELAVFSLNRSVA